MNRLNKCLLPGILALAALCGFGPGAMRAQGQAAPELMDKTKAPWMLSDYYRERAEKKVRDLHTRHAPETMTSSQAELRAELLRTSMMPVNPSSAQAVPGRVVTLDGLQVQHVLLKIRPGVASPMLVYLPPGASVGGTKKYPALLLLPGHGDPTWSPVLQNRCLGFAKQGYIVLFVQPYGQSERGENSLWGEDHDTQAMAFLMTAGQSLFGLIMSDHLAEMAYLRSRPDVDPDKVGVTGVSMGGTHSMWTAALDPQVKAAVSVASTPLYQPNLTLQTEGLCDLCPGAYKFGDSKMIESLIAPRALMNLYPSSGQPLNDAGMELLRKGKIQTEADVKKYAMDSGERAAYHNYQHQAFRKADAKDNFADVVIEGPHDYTKEMREAAAGWFAFYLKGSGSKKAIPEPALAPVIARLPARDLLYAWPKGDRPSDILAPTAYTKREISAQIAKLPPPPATRDVWKQERERIQTALRKRLGVEIESPRMRVDDLGQIQLGEAHARKLMVEPEPGIQLPMLLIEPMARAGAAPGGRFAVERLAVLLDPAGKSATANSEARQKLSREGYWTLCVDLRGQGETRHGLEGGYYLGFRDYDIAVAALKFGETLAGYWTKDLLAAVKAARKEVGGQCLVVVHGNKETGLIALFAAGLDDSIQEVETTGMLASCYSPNGYGRPYIYRDGDNMKPTKQNTGGYGSMVPCIPNLLEAGDIPQFAALIAPRRLTIDAPLQASGDPMSGEALREAFVWTRDVYRQQKANEALRIQ